VKKVHIFQIFCIWILLWIWVVCVVKDGFLSLFLLCFFMLFIFMFCISYKNTFLLWSISLALTVWYSYALYSLNTIEWNQAIVAQYMWSYVEQQWQVEELHSRKEFYDEYKLKIKTIWGKDIGGDISYLLRVPKNFDLIPNQDILYSWKLYPLENFDGFAYEDFLLSRNIYFSTSLQSFETLSKQEHGFRYTLWSWREQLLERISGIFPSSEAIFLWGILFWARENIPTDLKEDFNNSWLTHFIAVSGFNITLCIIFITVIFGFLPRYARIFCAIACIWFFCIFVWLWAPVVRAGIMGIIGYVFLQHGNSVNNLSLILVTVLLMSLYSPFSLIYDVSLHLSFLAVIGIIYTQEFFTKLFSWIPSFFAIREAFVLTLAALSFSLPIMIFQFGQVSLLLLQILLWLGVSLLRCSFEASLS